MNTISLSQVRQAPTDDLWADHSLLDVKQADPEPSEYVPAPKPSGPAATTASPGVHKRITEVPW